jgi:hypothetical protein
MPEMKWQDVGMEITSTLKDAPRGHRYQLMEVAASKFWISARRVRDIVACVDFLHEVSKSHPQLHAILAGRSVTDVARTLDAWRKQYPPRPLPTELPAENEKYVSAVLATARNARNVGISKRKKPLTEANFGDYLKSTRLTWVERDTFNRRFTASTEPLNYVARLRVGLEDMEDMTWQKPEGIWKYRKIHAVGYWTSSEVKQLDKAIVGVQFVKSPSLTHLRERAIGIFLGAMGLTHHLKQVILILPDELCFENALQMCQKAGFQNGNNNVWLMYPLGDITRPRFSETEF